MRRAIARGLVKREDIFITTKLWNNYHSYDDALAMATAQNEAWGLGYIDLYLIHFPCALKYIDPTVLKYPVSTILIPGSPPIFHSITIMLLADHDNHPFQAWWTNDKKSVVETASVPVRETWRALETLVDRGIARSIGVSNFQAQSLYDVWNYARHPLSALQIEHHPYLVQPDLVALAQEQGVAVTAYSSFGPQSFLELPAVFSERAKGAQPLLSSDLIKGIAEKHSVSPAQVLLRWATQRSIAVIPKSSSPQRMRQNFQVLEDDFSLSGEELDTISGLDRGLRFNDPGWYLRDCMDKPLRIFA